MSRLSLCTVCSNVGSRKRRNPGAGCFQRPGSGRAPCTGLESCRCTSASCTTESFPVPESDFATTFGFVTSYGSDRVTVQAYDTTPSDGKDVEVRIFSGIFCNLLQLLTSIRYLLIHLFSLNGSAPFPSPQTTAHQDHLNILNQRQQVQRQNNDYINRFYASNSVVLPQPPAPQQQAPQAAQSATLAATSGAQPTAATQLDLQNIALRRLAPATTAATLGAYQNQSLLLLSNIHNIHHSLAADMPMIFFPASTTGDFVQGYPDAVTHAVATAMHHAPEPQPVGATSDQVRVF